METRTFINILLVIVLGIFAIQVVNLIYLVVTPQPNKTSTPHCEVWSIQ